MNHFLTLGQLNKDQIVQYEQAITDAFPEILSVSPVILSLWSKLEQYFPTFQHFLITPNGELIGFINSLPFFYPGRLGDLPQGGWDWMISKGIADYEKKQGANYLGGLQVIVRKKYQGQGYSKQILTHAKEQMRNSSLSKLLIPIRPTRKHLFPTMPMHTYLNKREENKIYDPWIRTHLQGGAKIIKVCEESMTIKGDIQFWEKLMKKEIVTSGEYILAGSLSPIQINREKNTGVYIEPNIWIKYD